MANYTNLLRMTDLSPETLEKILKVSAALKKEPENTLLRGETLALIFEKPSLRTRVSFQLAAEEMGGRALVLRPDEIKMGVREAVKDIARYLSRNVTIAAMRVFSHGTLDEFAKYASIPVVNALCDEEHPCQAFADLLTVEECFGKIKGVNITYLGDGNNVCCSLLFGAAMTGANMTVGCPKGFEPPADIVEKVLSYAKESGSEIKIINDPKAAAKGADVLYTDVWVSMGQEDEKASKMKAFEGFCLDDDCLALASPYAIVLHCLPAHRGEEITDSVIESKNSRVFQEAENRRHVEKAALLYALGKLDQVKI
ncbi:ornithine carbamoyltransferase [bacterium]|nr:ornithine carbamoyltransferase [bacterium]